MDKTRCNGKWTEGRYRSFLTSILRSGARRWAPIQSTKKKARIRRGIYQCASCNTEVPATKIHNGKRSNNIFVDHIKPVVDPHKGFITWDEYIERLYCEEDNLQVLCKHCHDVKSKQEREIARNTKRNG